MKTHGELRKSGMKYVDCPACQGTGTIITNMHAQNCTECLGDGKIWQSRQCDKCSKELPADTSSSVYCCTGGSGCATVTAICSLCEFEHGWGYPFCRRCGTIFDPVPILERIKAYVAGVNADYSEDEERDQTAAMIQALINHAQTK